MCQCLNQNIPYKFFFRNKELKGSAKSQERRNKMGEGKNKAKSGKALSIVTTNPSGTFVWNSPQQARTQGFCLHRHCFWQQAVSLLANYGSTHVILSQTGGFYHRVIASGELFPFKCS